jgi:5-methylcytosine-specific restriction endonuclease McrA
MRSKLIKERGYKCEQCGSERYISVHHIRWQCHGGSDNADNLKLLCHSCHKFEHMQLPNIPKKSFKSSMNELIDELKAELNKKEVQK